MKKKLEAELISIAHRILQLKDTSSLSQLQEEARQLYEKLTILSFSETHFAGPQPTIGQVHAALEKEVESENNVAQQTEIEKDVEVKKEVQTEEIIEESIPVENKPELVIEEVNTRVTEDLFVPATTSVIDNDSFSESIYNQDKKEVVDEKPKSLNDQLKKDIHIGLNDRLAFIKYLFDGSAPDYNRVLSQLETLGSKREVMDFVATMIKPDYNNWVNKEEYEERFMDAVLGKFDN